MTPEQKAANEKLSAAVQEAVRAFKTLSDDAVIVDFVVVVEGQRMEKGEEVPREQTALLFPHGYARMSVAVGLLELGRHVLLSGETEEV